MVAASCGGGSAPGERRRLRPALRACIVAGSLRLADGPDAPDMSYDQDSHNAPMCLDLYHSGNRQIM